MASKPLPLRGLMEFDIRDYLAQAKRKSKTECPLALALKDAYGAKEVEVDGSLARVVHADGTINETDIGEGLSASIKHFDDTGEWPEGDGKSRIHLDTGIAAMISPTGTYKR